MNTSYFSYIAKHPELLSKCFAISNGVVPNWGGEKYHKLVPPWPIVQAYKSNGDSDKFSKAYQYCVLKDLDPQEVLGELGEDAILICWEGKDKFCHRHLVAQWLMQHLNTTVKEL